MSGIVRGQYWLLNNVAQKLVFYTVIILFFLGCKEGIETTPPNSFASYLQESSLTPVNDLIACAANNLGTIDNGIADSVAIFFLPISGASNFRYFETENDDIDQHDHNLYFERPIEDSPVFGGHLRKFTREATTSKKWCLVTFERGDSLYYANPILLKSPEINTEINMDLLTIDKTDVLRPIFSWQDGAIDENVIYFQVISDAEDNLISGTYTLEKSFQFYELSNVVLNVNDITPAPVLQENESYYFTLMAVSIDNWVNLIIRTPFETGE